MMIHARWFILAVLIGCGCSAWSQEHDDESNEEFFDVLDQWQDAMLHDRLSADEFDCLSDEELSRFAQIKEPVYFAQKIGEFKYIISGLTAPQLNDDFLIMLDVYMRAHVSAYLHTTYGSYDDVLGLLFRRFKFLMSQRDMLLVGAVQHGFYRFFEALLLFFEHAFPCNIVRTALPVLLNTLYEVRYDYHVHHMTLLHVAAKEGQTGMVDALLDRHCVVDARDDEGNTPLHWAAHYGHSDIVDQLVRSHAALEARNNDHATPLMVALQQKSYDAAQRLIDHGAVTEQLDGEMRRLFKIPGRERNMIAWLIYLLGSKKEAEKSLGNQTAGDMV